MRVIVAPSYQLQLYEVGSCKGDLALVMSPKKSRAQRVEARVLRCKQSLQTLAGLKDEDKEWEDEKTDD